MEISELIKIALENGFAKAAACDPQKLVFLDKVRSWCEDGRCGRYGKNWACPPHCGSVDEWRNQCAAYNAGVLVETVGLLEDSFDFEGMEQAAKTHKENLARAEKACRPLVKELLTLGAGACIVCETCSCPDAPCRFPDRRHVSMEACGLLVSDVCKDCGIPYINGENTVTYVSLYLFNL
ncbi:MAG: DUF2284 domain-containing protein [Firmicutes bacterium]|nr:DUF2284 domain-containing protein [Bacillota bacterium]